MVQKKRTASDQRAETKKIKNDLLLITGLLLGVSIIGAAFFFLRGEGDTVKVTVDGQVYGSFPLSEDRTVEIRTGENEENVNLLVIRDGEAYVESATCPDGICADHKPISRDRESIVCLPHRVVITVYGETDGGEADINT